MSAEDYGPMSAEAGLRRQFSSLLIGRLTAALLQACAFVAAARWSSIYDFGLFAQVFGLLIFAQAVSDVGLLTTITRLRAKQADPTLLSRSVRCAEITIGISGSIALVSLCVIAIINPVFWQLVPLAVWFIGERTTETWLRIDLADGRINPITWSLVLRRVCFLGGAVIGGTSFDGGGVFGLAIGAAVGTIVTGTIARSRNKSRIKRERLRLCDFRSVFRLSSGFWIVAMADQSRNLDTVIVGAVGGSGTAGEYAVGARMAGPLRMLPDSLASIMLPHIARKTPGHAGGLIKPILMALVATATVCSLIVVVSPAVIPVLLGQQYESAVGIVQLTCVAVAFLAIDSQSSALLQGWGFARTSALISVVATCQYLVMIAIGALKYGALGAAVGFAASAAVQGAARSLVVLTVVRRRRRLRT